MNWMDLLALLGGLGLFLFGMKLMGDGLEKAAGPKLKKVLELLTGSRLRAVLSGLMITAVIQSSSATTVMVVGFVNGGLLTLTQAVGVIMGANIGTTVTSLLLSVKIDFSVLLACAGLVLSLPKRESLRQSGMVCMGLAILFTGMNWMSDAMVPLREWEGFRQILSSISHPLPGIAAGALMTAVLQSSSAAVGILQALTAQELIPLSSGIYILFGQNIGTCVTALIASAGTNTTARRAAVVHLLFNVAGTAFFALAAAWLPLADGITALAPDNLRLQIALIHLFFNVTTTLLLYPFAPALERCACALIPHQKRKDEQRSLLHFDSRMLTTPSIAVQQLVRETAGLSALAQTSFNCACRLFFHWKADDFDHLTTWEDIMDERSRLLTEALVDASGTGLTDHDRHVVGALFHLVNDLERVGDHAVNIAERAQERTRDHLTFSDDSLRELQSLCTLASGMLKHALRGQSVAMEEEEMDAAAKKLRELNIARLQGRQCAAQCSAVYLDLLTDLERVGDHANNVADLLASADIRLKD